MLIPLEKTIGDRLREHLRARRNETHRVRFKGCIDTFEQPKSEHQCLADMTTLIRSFVVDHRLRISQAKRQSVKNNRTPREQQQAHTEQ